MKKLLAILAVTGVMTSCSDSATTNETPANDSASTQIAPPPPPASDTIGVASGDAAMKDGVMTMKDGKMMVMKGGSWAPMTEDFTTTNGRKVSTKGVVSKGDKKKELTEGMMIDADGQMRDKDGKLLDNTGWE